MQAQTQCDNGQAKSSLHMPKACSNMSNTTPSMTCSYFGHTVVATQTGQQPAQAPVQCVLQHSGRSQHNTCNNRIRQLQVAADPDVCLSTLLAGSGTMNASVLEPLILCPGSIGLYVRAAGQ